MTDTDLNIAIAEAKGWTEIAPGHDGRLMGVPPGEKLVGYVPDYTGDPREFVPLWDQIVKHPAVKVFKVESVAESALGGPHHIPLVFRTADAGFESLTDRPHPMRLGDAVCLAWLAVNEAKENSHES